MPDEAEFMSGAALCTAVTGESAIFQPLLKRHLVVENEFPKMWKLKGTLHFFWK